MAPEDQSIGRLLYDALISHAERSGFRLGQEAAHFIVDHAVYNTNQSATTEEERRAHAQKAVDALPDLERSIRRHTGRTDFPGRDSVIALMKTCDGPYPWCSRVP
jgi:hypothetical protein